MAITRTRLRAGSVVSGTLTKFRKGVIATAIASTLLMSGQAYTEGIGSVTQEWLYATTENRNAFAAENPSSLYLQKYDRWGHSFSSQKTKSKIKVGYNNWILSSSTGYTAGNAHTITAAYAEYNGVAVQLTFGGLTTRSVAAGESDIVSDELTPAQFGATSFAIGTYIYTKFFKTVATTSTTLPYTARYVSDDPTNNQSWWYNASATTIVNSGGVGVCTYTGTAPSSRANGGSPFIIGYGDDEMTPIFFGNSITAGLGDGTASASGRGYPARLAAYMGFGCAQLSTSGVSANQIQANIAIMSVMAKYANRFFIKIGTNDFGSTGASTTIANLKTYVNTIVNYLKANYPKITKYGAGGLLVRTTSTDGWATLENQTPFSGWDSTAGNPHVWSNTTLQTMGFDFICLFNCARDVTYPFKFPVKGDGTQKYFNNDDTHPSTVLYLLMRDELAPFFAAMR